MLDDPDANNNEGNKKTTSTSWMSHMPLWAILYLAAAVIFLLLMYLRVRYIRKTSQQRITKIARFKILQFA